MSMVNPALPCLVWLLIVRRPEEHANAAICVLHCAFPSNSIIRVCLITLVQTGFRNPLDQAILTFVQEKHVRSRAKALLQQFF